MEVLKVFILVIISCSSYSVIYVSTHYIISQDDQETGVNQFKQTKYQHNVSSSNGRANIFNEFEECKMWNAEDRVNGGIQAEIGELPCIALLEYLADNGAYSFDCTGSLLNHRYVVTAAQCLYNKRLINVRLGEYDVNQNPDCDEDGECQPNSINVGVEEITIHPNYSTTQTSRHDIGLIRLSMDVPYEIYFIKPICVPDETVSIAVGEVAKVGGWGGDGEGIKTSFLRSVWIKVVDPVECENKYNKRVMIYSTQLCAGGARNRNACVEDLGGPLLMRKDLRSYLIGIVSFSSGCRRDGVPDVYTKVSSYYKWIQANLKP